MSLEFRDRFRKRQEEYDYLEPTSFKHEPDGQLGSIEQINGPKFRTYKTPEGNEYPSVTTILGVRKSPELEAWREAVGEEFADEWTSRAARRGTMVHEMAELYLNNSLPSLTGYPDKEKASFKKLKKILDEKITKVYYQEANLYSDKYRLAGKVDLICDFEGCRAITDFKTSNQKKRKEDISGYFIQTTAYSLMYEERTGIRIDKLVIIMDVEADVPIIFEEDRSNWIGELRAIRKEFYNKWKI